MKKRKTIKNFCFFFFCLFCCSAFLSPPGILSQELKTIEQASFLNKADLISINFKDTDIREILNVIAYKSGVNIVAGDDVAAKVSIQIKDVPWEKALDVLLKTYNFTYKKEGNLIRIMSLQRAKDEEAKVPLVTKIIALNFAKVDTIRSSLVKMLSARGSIEIDSRTNSLVITDLPEIVAQIEESAKMLDSRTPQVLIEAMMVDVKLSDEDKLGFEWTFKDGDKQFYQKLSLANAETDSSGNFGFHTLYGKIDITGLVDFWQQQNKAEILANPRVVTLDNQEAKIEILEEIPYTETVSTASGTTTTVKFKEAGIKLHVLPHITGGGYISMSVKPEQSFQSSTFLGEPIIDKRTAETNLLVKDGQTIVIGGLRKKDNNVTYTKTPVIGDIPFLGLLFRKKELRQVDTELILFVTPRIIGVPVLKENESKLLGKITDLRDVNVDERTEKQKFDDWLNRNKEKRAEATQQAIESLNSQKKEPRRRVKKSKQPDITVVPMEDRQEPAKHLDVPEDKYIKSILTDLEQDSDQLKQELNKIEQ